MAMNYEANMSAGQDWAGEVTPGTMDWNQPRMGGELRFPPAANSMGGGLQMQNNLPSEVIEAPTTVNEAYLGSLKAMLMRNRGNYIVATFLVGTQNTVSWEGILYDVGNDYVTIYQPGRDRYVVSDIYSLRYMEFYDTRRREMCDRLLAQQGMGGMSGMGNNMGNMQGNMGGNMQSNMSGSMQNNMPGGGVATTPRGW